MFRVTYRDGMTGEPTLIGPRDGLDNGSVHDLALDGAEVDLDVHPAQPWAFPRREIAVPDRAPGLLDGIAAYGG